MPVGSLNYLSSPFDVEWKIPEFSSLAESEWHSSSSFSFHGQAWHLQIFSSVDCIGINVERESSGPPINLEFSTSFKTSSGQKDRETRCQHVFNGRERDCLLIFFINRSDLLEKRCELLLSDVLTVACILKVVDPSENMNRTCSPRSPSDAHEKEVLLDLKKIFLNKEDSDLTIKVEDQEFPAHSCILKARSPVLAATFRNEMKEKNSGILEIDDCDPSSFSEFLCFLYCGRTNISAENVFSLFKMADKYDVRGLRTECLNIVKENLSVDTFCETITLALMHSETELIELATDFFIKNAPQIIVTAKWQSFLAENPTYANELFVKFAASASVSANNSRFSIM